MHVYACICKYVYAILTDNRVSSHVLADNRRIAAQEHGQGRIVPASKPLAGLVHLTAVDGTILALVSD